MGDTAVPSAIPEIETDRLIIRAHRLGDYAECVAMWADPVVTRHIGGKPSMPQQTWMRILGYAGHWSLLGFGYWAVEERSSGTFIGELGFADFKRDIVPRIDNTPELGWAFASRAHGKGFATEATRAVVAWGDRNLPSSRTVCIINPANAASIRVAEKIGFREITVTVYNGEPVLLFERIAERR